MVTLRNIAVIPMIAILVTSCNDFASSLKVLVGNVNHARGEHQKSILNYLDAGELLQGGRDVVLYNLANIYYSLGEEDAALQTWNLAESITEDKDILYKIAFNRGVFFYRKGRFHEAYSSFRQALRLNPSDVDTKINLEDSLLRISEFIGTEKSRLDAKDSIDELAEEDGNAVWGEGEHLLDYVKRKEANAWQGASVESESAEEDW